MHKILIPFTFLLITVSTGCTSNQPQVSTLKSALADKFFIGVAMNTSQITGKDTLSDRIISDQFNSVVAENCMKSEVIQPREGEFNFTLADQFVAFGEKNLMKIIGHTLIWHSQAPAWFFVDSLGNDVSKEVLIDRMRKHISTVVGRYKGRVQGWDVVNEAINDDGSYRESKFYKIIGPEYIKLAFEFAREADPRAELYYNDYSMAVEGRRNGVVMLIKELQQQGVKVDGIGMQCHCTLDFPSIAEEEKSIIAFSQLGVKVMITELDLTMLPFPSKKVGADVAMSFEYQQAMNPYPQQLPDSMVQAFNKRYADLFGLFIKHADKIDRVTVWGLNDAQSWRNDWPIVGRKDYPLLFDRNNQPKPIVAEIINMVENNLLKP
jgi:endo-1,4-beta-xylanase